MKKVNKIEIILGVIFLPFSKNPLDPIENKGLIRSYNFEEESKMTNHGGKVQLKCQKFFIVIIGEME